MEVMRKLVLIESQHEKVEFAYSWREDLSWISFDSLFCVSNSADLHAV